MAVVEIEKPDGVIVQFGGQTPLKLAKQLEAAGVPIIGTSPDAIDLAEDRERFQSLLHRLELNQPDNATARSVDEALSAARSIGYPVVVRPSYVLGGRAMQIVHDESGLLRYMREAVQASPDHPVLLDRFLNDAIELDVDALCDGKVVVIGGIMEHIEEAGVHSGDSACSLPPYSIQSDWIEEVARQTELLALNLGVIGLINIQFALQGDKLYVLEVNPRASRTVPFVSKAMGVPLAKVAARIMAGQSLVDQGIADCFSAKNYFTVKEAVFPFVKFHGVDPLLNPEMKSTGEVMGIGPDFASAYHKAQLGVGQFLPHAGRVFISVRDKDKAATIELARMLGSNGFEIMATSGTHAALEDAGINSTWVGKVIDGVRPHIVDILLSGDVNLVINTTEGAQAIYDSKSIRQATLDQGIPYFTTVEGGLAAAGAILSPEDVTRVCSIQEYHARGDC